MKVLVAKVLAILLVNPILVAANWYVTIEGVYGQSLDFSTGDGFGASIKVELFDVCRVDSATRQALGELYPGNNVYGMQADASSIVNDPGCCNKIIYNFLPEINQTAFYTNNGDTGTIAFCAQVALYDGGALVNLAEVKVQYTMYLPQGDVYLDTYTITDAAGFTDADDTGLSFDGSLYAYFCDPNSHTLVDYGVAGQGAVLSVCFNVPDGQFEIKDVIDLTIESADGYGPSQDIVRDFTVVEDTIALKTCHDYSDSDTNVCVIQFLLKHDFYETSAITLSGSGTLLLELGDSEQRMLSSSTTQSTLTIEKTSVRGLETTEGGHFMSSPYQIKASRFFVEADTTSGKSEFPSLTRSDDPTLNGVIFAVIVVACILTCCMGAGLITNRVFSESKDKKEGQTDGEGKTVPATKAASVTDDPAAQSDVA